VCRKPRPARPTRRQRRTGERQEKEAEEEKEEEGEEGEEGGRGDRGPKAASNVPRAIGKGVDRNGRLHPIARTYARGSPALGARSPCEHLPPTTTLVGIVTIGIAQTDWVGIATRYTLVNCRTAFCVAVRCFECIRPLRLARAIAISLQATTSACATTTRSARYSSKSRSVRRFARAIACTTASSTWTTTAIATGNEAARIMMYLQD